MQYYYPVVILPVFIPPQKVPQRNPLVESVDTFENARLILSAGSFEKHPSDHWRDADNGFSVCEAQGTPNLREMARKYTKDCPRPLSYESVRLAMAFNAETARIMQLKRHGHALNLTATVHLVDGKKISLCGFSEAFSIPMVASSIKEYAHFPHSFLGEEEGEWVSRILSNSYSHDSYKEGDAQQILRLIHDEEYLDPISFASGYDWHATHMIYFRGFLIHCNRGYGSGKPGGVSVWQIPDKKKITKELLEGLIKRQTISVGVWKEKYSISAIEKELSITQIYLSPQGPQTTRNCTYASTKSAAKALFAIYHLKQKYPPKQSLESDVVWHNAFKQTRQHYKSWVNYDKHMAIADLIKDTITLFDGKIPVISGDELRKIFRITQRKVLDQPKKYPTLINYFRELKV